MLRAHQISQQTYRAVGLAHRRQPPLSPQPPAALPLPHTTPRLLLNPQCSPTPELTRPRSPATPPHKPALEPARTPVPAHRTGPCPRSHPSVHPPNDGSTQTSALRIQNECAAIAARGELPQVRMRHSNSSTGMLPPESLLPTDSDATH